MVQRNSFYIKDPMKKKTNQGEPAIMSLDIPTDLDWVSYMIAKLFRVGGELETKKRPEHGGTYISHL